MTQKEMLDMANRFYPDGFLENYYDAEGNFVDPPTGGDGLAKFIVGELLTVTDGDDPAILENAKTAMHRAMDDICAVLAGLDGLVSWRGN